MAGNIIGMLSEFDS